MLSVNQLKEAEELLHEAVFGEGTPGGRDLSEIAEALEIDELGFAAYAATHGAEAGVGLLTGLVASRIESSGENPLAKFLPAVEVV